MTQKEINELFSRMPDFSKLKDLARQLLKEHELKKEK